MEINQSFPDSITHSVVVMHSRPMDEQFNNNVAKPFNYYISGMPGMDAGDGNADSDDPRIDGSRAKGFCINGHNHKSDIIDLFDNGILYYQCPNMEKREFFVFTITAEGYEFEQVCF